MNKKYEKRILINESNTTATSMKIKLCKESLYGKVIKFELRTVHEFVLDLKQTKRNRDLQICLPSLNIGGLAPQFACQLIHDKLSFNDLQFFFLSSVSELEREITSKGY